MKPETIKIDDVEYVRKDSIKELSDDYFIVRTYSAGVFFGKIVKREGIEAVIADARRLWYWNGAASLSQMAVEGVKKPNECKFAMPVPVVILTQVIEILPCTTDAAKNIQAVPIWKS